MNILKNNLKKSGKIFFYFRNYCYICLNQKINRMNYLHPWLEFDSIEEGEKKLAEAQNIREQMSGAFYWNIIDEDCKEIAQKIEELKKFNNK